METALVSGIIALGYLLSNNNKNNTQVIANIPSKSIPNGTNTFNSNRVNQIRWGQQKISDKKYDQIFNEKNRGSNLVIPGPTTPFFDKVDYTDNTLPVTFNDKPRMNVGVKTYNPSEKVYQEGLPTGNPISDGWYGVSLTGEPIDPKNFQHNNQTPFFGSHVRQNVDEYTNNSIVENFTGNSIQSYKKKSEIPQLFDPEANITNPYGMSNLSGYQRERYIVSNKRTNEAPTAKIYVGPGLNKGYTACPSGGFQQAETRDYILPKTVDELRVKTNPKLTYNIPVIAGQHISGPGKVGVVQKNRPDSFAVWGPDRYFVTTGDRVKPKQRAEVVFKHSNRLTTDIRRAVGPAGVREGFSQQGIRSNVKVSERCQYTPGGPRGVDGSGRWTIPDECPPEQSNYVPMQKCDSAGFPETNQLTKPVKDHRNSAHSIHDYGRSGLSLARTNREDTSCIPNGNITGLEQQRHVPITSELRPTRKEDFVGNTRWASNVQGRDNKGVVWDPNDIARTTMNEMTMGQAPTVNMAAQRPSNAPVYDPNDVARTTMNEMTMGPAPTVNVQGHDNKGVVWDPNDIARTTMNEMTMGQAPTVNMAAQRPSKAPVYDPNQVLKTTNKETTTSDYSGNAYLPNEDKRDANKYEARNTNRQFTSDVEYYGNYSGDQEGGYQVTNVDPRLTNRQFTSNNSHVGNAGGGAESKPRQDGGVKNMEIRSYRETLSKGRVPAREGPKDSLDPRMVHATTNKSGDQQNSVYSQRAMMSTKVYNSLPQANKCSKTKNKKTINNAPIRNRLDASLLDEFKKNPYSQSLEAYWTY